MTTSDIIRSTNRSLAQVNKIHDNSAERLIGCRYSHSAPLAARLYAIPFPHNVVHCTCYPGTSVPFRNRSWLAISDSKMTDAKYRRRRGAPWAAGDRLPKFRAAPVAADSTFQRRCAAGREPVTDLTVFNPCDVSAGSV